MFDIELTKEVLSKILWSIDRILKRTEKINDHEDFYLDDKGYEILDSVCMQLINIGEAIKQIDKITDNKLLIKYNEIDWKSAKGMRDIISHHYFDVDSEIVLNVIREKLPEMKIIIQKILDDISTI